MFGKPEEDDDGQEVCLCKWTSNAVSYRDMKQENVVKHSED